ncbi:MAG TPA: hypothetical protein VIS06_06375 [Mycobacteriales bacterium]
MTRGDVVSISVVGPAPAAGSRTAHTRATGVGRVCGVGRASLSTGVTASSAPGTRTGLQVRSCAMLLLNENLSRVRRRECEQQTEVLCQCRRVLALRRRQQRTQQAARRARLVQNAVC